MIYHSILQCQDSKIWHYSVHESFVVCTARMGRYDTTYRQTWHKGEFCNDNRCMLKYDASFVFFNGNIASQKENRMERNNKKEIKLLSETIQRPHDRLVFWHCLTDFNNQHSNKGGGKLPKTLIET